jgi:flagellar L-ring protein precursor FlgH
MKRKHLSLTILSVACAIPAMAQTRSSEKENTRANSSVPAAPLNNNAAAQAGAIMQRTGASLLQAQLAAQPDPAQAKLEQVSFFAVPEPKPKTLKKHDLVTIIVREESDIQTKGLTDVKKNAELQAQVNQMVKFKLSNLSIYGLPTPSAQPGVDLQGNRILHGEGEFDRQDSMTARIEAEIVDVKPNGTLVLQARKRIKADEEEQVYLLNGICRVEDVTADGTVLSTQLHDLDLQKTHKGIVKSATERGVLPKLLDFINPY